MVKKFAHRYISYASSNSYYTFYNVIIKQLLLGNLNKSKSYGLYNLK